RWFKVHYPGLGFGHLQKLLRSGQVRVDGGRVKADSRVEPGQTVRIDALARIGMEHLVEIRFQAGKNFAQNLFAIRKVVVQVAGTDAAVLGNLDGANVATLLVHQLHRCLQQFLSIFAGFSRPGFFHCRMHLP
ncbi:MAG: hypothetical protein L0H83_04055, partial [Salinisphaera sp.]|nr:hypothetical protein [Salinisphaera sp.]